MSRWIYVIRPDSGPIKVGVTGNLPRRLTALQTSSPVKLWVHGAVLAEDGVAQKIEALSHFKLTAYRLSGEWFSASAEEALNAIVAAASELDAEIAPWVPPPPKAKAPQPTKLPSLPRALLVRLVRLGGEALYGNQWQTPLAKAIGVSDRTMRRWVTGQSHVPTSAADEMMQVAAHRANGIEQLLLEISAARPTPSPPL